MGQSSQSPLTNGVKAKGGGNKHFEVIMTSKQTRFHDTRVH